VPGRRPAHDEGEVGAGDRERAILTRQRRFDQAAVRLVGIGGIVGAGDGEPAALVIGGDDNQSCRIARRVLERHLYRQIEL
jgi:hypothetical protein